MKKGLIFLLGIMSFLGINIVSAREIYLEYDTNVNQIQSYINDIGYSVINEAINKTIKYYNENLSNNYPYYFISLRHVNLTTDTSTFYVTLTSFDNFSDYFADHIDQTGNSYIQLIDWSYNGFYRNASQISYNFDTNEIIHTAHDIPIITLNSTDNYFLPYNYYYSNFDYHFPGQYILDSGCEGAGCLSYLHSEDNLYFPYFDNPDKYTSYPANIDFLIEPYYLYDNNESLQIENYTTINLNDYAYVILSLKDYTPRDTFTTTMYVKGQLCPTTVYNYGTEEKKDYISGWQNQDCGTYYDTYTRHLNYIRSEDITNHAVYYLTGYDSTKENLVKVNPSVYNVTYITEEQKDNPEVNIGGKNYSTLPYDKLTDTAIKTEQNGVNNTWTCAKYDTDCFMDSSGIDIDSLFSNPIETLKTVWSAIISIFSLIAEFILLLPPTMQAFLYLAFGVGVALGIIKILV